jgi:cell division protein FtsQ
MAKVKKAPAYKNGGVKRVSPLKPGLRGAKAWTASKVRAAGHSQKSFLQFCGGIFAVFVAITVVALWLGGFWPQIIQNGKTFKQNRLMDMGFVVARVDVMGEGRLNEQDVLKAVNVRPGDYFFGVDLKEAQRRTESLPWVDRAVVRRLWPNRIVVQLVENQPYAVWQNKGQLALINKEGDVIAPVSVDISIPTGLIHIVGEGAAAEAAELEDMLSDWQGLNRRVTSAILVSGKRWNIILDDAVTVKLPSVGIEVALAKLAKLQNQTQILDRAVSEIDLRLMDRISILPTAPEQA